MIIGILMCVILSGFTNRDPLKSQDKSPVRIYLEHFRSQEMIQLSVRVLSKPEKRYRPASGIEIALYRTEISAPNLLGTILTTKNGTGTYTFDQKQFELAENTKVAHYVAVVSENDTLQHKETSINIKDVNLDVRFVVEDSIKQIYAHISEIDSLGTEIPQEGVDIKFLVERPLSLLPLGDDYNTTDEDGNITMVFPDDLPGDTEGNLKLIVRIVENDDYGIVEISEVKRWGILTFVQDNTVKRTLWASSANAPIALLIFINSLIAAVWGIIFYIVYKIFRIRKLGVE